MTKKKQQLLRDSVWAWFCLMTFSKRKPLLCMRPGDSGFFASISMQRLERVIACHPGVWKILTVRSGLQIRKVWMNRGEQDLQRAWVGRQSWEGRGQVWRTRYFTTYTLGVCTELCLSLQNSYFEALTHQDFRMWPYLEIGLKEGLSHNEAIRCVLIPQSDWCAYRRGDVDTRRDTRLHACTQKRGHLRTQGTGGHLQGKERGLVRN